MQNEKVRLIKVPLIEVIGEFTLDDSLKSQLCRAIFSLVNLCAIPANTLLRHGLSSLAAGGLVVSTVYFYDKEFNNKVVFAQIIGGGAIGLLSYLAKRQTDKYEKEIKKMIDIDTENQYFLNWLNHNKNVHEDINNLADAYKHDDGTGYDKEIFQKENLKKAVDCYYENFHKVHKGFKDKESFLNYITPRLRLIKDYSYGFFTRNHNYSLLLISSNSVFHSI